MARKAAAVATPKEVEVELSPEQVKALEKEKKRVHEAGLQQIRVRMGKAELPMFRSGEKPRYCVIPKKFDKFVREVAEQRGYAICIGELSEEAAVQGFALYAEKPEDVEMVSGEDHTMNTKQKLAAATPRVIPKTVEMPGIPILYAVVTQSVSPEMGSVSREAERHFDARIAGRGGLEVSMGANGPYLHIRTKRGAAVNYLLVPMTNVVKMHPDPAFVADEGWGAEPKTKKKDEDDDEEAGKE